MGLKRVAQLSACLQACIFFLLSITPTVIVITVSGNIVVDIMIITYINIVIIIMKVNTTLAYIRVGFYQWSICITPLESD